jgi:DNA anti-recombination protein RmuC
MVEAVVTSVLEEALRQASERIAKKIAEGKRLTSTDVIILLLDQMNKRMEAMNESLNKRIDDLNSSLNKRIDDTNRRIDDLSASLNKRIDDTNKRIDDLNTSLNKRIDETNKRINEIKEDLKLLHQEVSSIKSDVIALMREKLKTG